MITGFVGALYTILAVTAVAGFFWSPRNKFLVWICKFVGDVSYGLYLIHPLCWIIVGALMPSMPVPSRIAVTIASSAAAAWILLRIYERPVKRWLLNRAHGIAPEPAKQAAALP